MTILYSSLSFLCHWTLPSATDSRCTVTLQPLSPSQMSEQHAFLLWAVLNSPSCCAVVTVSTQAWNLSPLCQQMLQAERRASVRGGNIKEQQTGGKIATQNQAPPSSYEGNKHWGALCFIDDEEAVFSKNSQMQWQWRSKITPGLSFNELLFVVTEPINP